MDVEQLKKAAQSEFEAVEAELRQISRWMYENPEIAYQEHESARRLTEFLDEAGFDAELGVYGLDTAFVARAGSDGPELVICAEYDALPDVGHACGHNIIAVSALGAAAALLAQVEELGFRLIVLGTPAEEHWGGKVDLIKAGAFENAAASMMVHPSPFDVVDPLALAIRHLELVYTGFAAHAAAFPQLGINALDAFVQAYVNVSTLRQHLYPTDKIHGIVTKGGAAPNIIPAETRSSWYVRAENKGRLEELNQKVTACFEAGALATGCEWDVHEQGHPYDELRNNPIMADLFAANSQALGRKMLRGEDLPVGTTGSTDMGNVSQIVPSIHPMLSIDSFPAVNHQPEFAAHTITEDGERAIRDGALGMAWTAIDLAVGNHWDELTV